MIQGLQDSSWHHQLTTRLRAHWQYKLVAGSLLAIGFNVVYFLFLYYPIFPVTEMPVTSIDNMIGFWSTSLLIYTTLWIYIALSAWLLTDRQELVGFIKALTGLSMAGLAFFFFWPTSVPRPIIDLEEFPSFKYLVAIDEPRNVFPSLHAAFSIFSVVSIDRTLRQWSARTLLRVLSWCWCIAIIYSALATKQHLAVDLFAGGALGAAWAWFYQRSLFKVQNQAELGQGNGVCTKDASGESAMHEPISVNTVVSRQDRRRFQHFVWSIYALPGARDPHWVAPLLAQERELLGWGCHPFFDNAKSVTLLAWRDGKVVGRLMVLINPIHNQKHNEHLGFFGFFECINDADVASALFEAGGYWLRERGMTRVRGPVNLSLNYTCGLLIDGFSRAPCFLMPYNPPYYASLLESCGFFKAQDMYAYEMDVSLLAKLTERYKPAVLSSLEKSTLAIRPFNPSKYQQEIATYLDIYNRSLEGTWGFTPLQPSEARHIGRELRHVLEPQFAAFVECDGKPVGALLALLDYNQILRKLNGRLFPLGFLRILLGRRHITTARAMAVTMVPGHQNAGLGIVLLDHLVGAAAKWGIERYEFSWVLESNKRSRGTLERAGTQITATYRIYDKAL